MFGIKKAKAAAARRIGKVTRPINLRIARWVLRKRAFVPFMLLQTWPLLLVAGLILWSLTKPSPHDVRPWLYYCERSTRGVFSAGLLIDAYYSAKKRWRRLTLADTRQRVRRVRSLGS